MGGSVSGVWWVGLGFVCRVLVVVVVGGRVKIELGGGSVVEVGRVWGLVGVAAGTTQARERW